MGKGLVEGKTPVITPSILWWKQVVSPSLVQACTKLCQQKPLQVLDAADALPAGRAAASVWLLCMPLSTASIHIWGAGCSPCLASMHECHQAVGLLGYLHTYCSLDVGCLGSFWSLCAQYWPVPAVLHRSCSNIPDCAACLPQIFRPWTMSARLCRSPFPSCKSACVPQLCSCIKPCQISSVAASCLQRCAVPVPDCCHAEVVPRCTLTSVPVLSVPGCHNNTGCPCLPAGMSAPSQRMPGTCRTRLWARWARGTSGVLSWSAWR